MNMPLSVGRPDAARKAKLRGALTEDDGASATMMRTRRLRWRDTRSGDPR